MPMMKGLIELPDFNLAGAEIPRLQIKSMRFENYKVFDDYYLDFSDGGTCNSFSCFFGPNGCGKTTILDCIQMIFSRYEGYEVERLKARLGKSVRHVAKEQAGIYDDSDFLITAVIQTPEEEYEIRINKTGFVQDHPDRIKPILYRLCFYARFDFELHQFQLARDKWEIFQDLFSSVTGFEIEEKSSVFDMSEDPVQADLMRKYVLGFWVHKPHESIGNNECSAGERKIIKSFSTLLNKEYTPSIILVDNVAMHVESGRHLHLIESMKRCFPDSQIFATTHSYQISKNFGNKNQLYDLRLINCPDLIKSEPWRLYFADEIRDLLAKLESLAVYKEVAESTIQQGKRILQRCFEQQNDALILRDMKVFTNEAMMHYANDLVMSYGYKQPKVRAHHSIPTESQNVHLESV